MNPILIVDDNEQILEILTQYIRAEGWPYLTAASGEEALSLFDAASPSLIRLRQDAANSSSPCEKSVLCG